MFMFIFTSLQSCLHSKYIYDSETKAVHCRGTELENLQHPLKLYSFQGIYIYDICNVKSTYDNQFISIRIRDMEYNIHSGAQNKYCIIVLISAY